MVIPIFITILGALILSATMTFTYFPPGFSPNLPDITPVPTPPDGGVEEIAFAALLNALIYVTFALIGGVIFVYLLRQGLHRIIEIIFASIMGISAYLFGVLLIPAVLFQSLELLSIVLPVLSLTSQNYELIGNIGGLSLAIINFMILGLPRFRRYEKLHNVLMIIFGMGMGTIFGILFDTISLIVVLLALGIYDIYAVFYGPLKQMFETIEETSEDESKIVDSLEKNNSISPKSSEGKSHPPSSTEAAPSPPLTSISALAATQEKLVAEPMFGGISLPIYTTPSISIGLGDFVFFSVLISKAVFLAIHGDFFLLAPTDGNRIYIMMLILPFIGIILGTYITFRLLEKREILPALPIPLMCGIIGFFLAVLLQF